jgi:hypothetical protein
MRQSIRLQREPFETEISEEVEKEYQRLEAERFGKDEGTEKNIADMATRMEELEAKLDASNERLEVKIDASQSRLEAMFQQLLASRAPTPCTPPVSPRDIHGVGVSVLLPILADAPRNTAKEKEVVSSELTMRSEKVLQIRFILRGVLRWRQRRRTKTRLLHRAWTLPQLGLGQV